MIARLLGQKLNTQTGQPFVIDNRAGGSGQIGMPAVAKSPADGYTLTVSPASFLTTNKSIFKSLAYDPEADFAPVSRLVNQPMVMVVKFNHCDPFRVLHVPFSLPSSWTRLHQPFSPSAPNFC